MSVKYFDATSKTSYRIATKPTEVSIMIGASASSQGEPGLVRPAVSEQKDYFLKGNGKWDEIVAKEVLIYHDEQDLEYEEIENAYTLDDVVGLNVTDLVRTGVIRIPDEEIEDRFYTLGVDNGEMYVARILKDYETALYNDETHDEVEVFIIDTNDSITDKNGKTFYAATSETLSDEKLYIRYENDILLEAYPAEYIENNETYSFAGSI